LVEQKTLPLKIEGDFYSCNIVKSKCDNQIALSDINVEGERSKCKKIPFLIKSNIVVSN